VFIRARHLSLSWAQWIQSTPPNPISLRSILMLSSHLRLGRPSGLLPSGLPTKMLYALQQYKTHQWMFIKSVRRLILYNKGYQLAARGSHLYSLYTLFYCVLCVVSFGRHVMKKSGDEWSDHVNRERIFVTSFPQPLALLPLDSSPLFRSTNQNHQIQLVTYCPPYIAQGLHKRPTTT
jgi:hypothetical protein